jgi:hypothetical protein
MTLTRSLAFLSLLLLAAPASAKVSAEEAKQLGANLTPLGAEKAGNQEGTIPAWTGKGVKPPRGWKVGDPRKDPFADDKVLYTIDKSNVDEYADKLAPGQIHLIKSYDGYRMNVYKTRRSCVYPDWVYEKTKRNATVAELDDDRIYLKAGWGSFLFPIPKDGAEAIWNHQYAFQSQGKIEYYAIVVPTKSGDMTPVHEKFTYDAAMFSPNVNSLEEAQGRAASALLERVAPPRLAGQVFLVHEMVNEQRRAWSYNPGQRRVRRAPTVAYDNPLQGTESLMTNDQVRMFNGIIDRFDFKLLGKKEMIIPYNSFGISYAQGKTLKDVLGPQYPDRDRLRYELHRVWVVEATVRKGKRHVFGKRVFYLDEDSWLAVHQDIYDKRGNLWRVMDGMIVPIAEVPTCSLDGTFSYDLVAGRYVADRIKTESPPSDWLAGREGRSPPQSSFTPDALRRAGRR